MRKWKLKVSMACQIFLQHRSGVYSWLVKVLGQFSIIYFRGLGLRIGVRVRVGVRVWVRVRVRVRVSVVLWSG